MKWKVRRASNEGDWQPLADYVVESDEGLMLYLWQNVDDGNELVGLPKQLAQDLCKLMNEHTGGRDE